LCGQSIFVFRERESAKTPEAEIMDSLKRWNGVARALGLVIGALAGVSGANATVIYNFSDITHNDAAAAAVGEAQLYVAIDQLTHGVSFTFYNTGPAPCSITDIYMQDGPILGLATIIDGTGTDFEQGATPHNLPGGNLASPPFVATEQFSAQSQPPVQPMGVNPGEHVELDYTLISGKTVADVVHDLDSGALRIGLHVQGFASGSSESFVNSVPTPGALAILGLGGLVMLRRRKR
jgi:MYXO-CTERM domain-containing protein